MTMAVPNAIGGCGVREKDIDDEGRGRRVVSDKSLMSALSGGCRVLGVITQEMPHGRLPMRLKVATLAWRSCLSPRQG
ncbi:hypothetical protein E2C01_045181 [Portunus trituberculatus]|uniref:Uncharacterized protein n=1 Tax=Portunus trituberculatus TaxID=210409 RepID=A0A5B7G0K1_PORTR|nr:hypothetical protein [Portunus trituberculatus]